MLITRQASAELSASVDRTRIAENDILSLTIRSTSGQIDENLDLSGLEPDFTLLNTRRNNRISIINGRREAHYDVILVIAPNRTGRLTIPSFTSQGERTNPIAIEVQAAGSRTSSQQLSDAFLDAEVSTPQAYVQEQIIYTLRLYHSVLLDEANLTNLEVENAIVRRLGDQTKYETILEGIRYTVIELRYAIFPQRSGMLHIPALTFNGRSLSQYFGLRRSEGKFLRAQSPGLDIQVLPKPAEYPENLPWLPTHKLELEDSWDRGLPDFRVGEPVTRTISIKGHGLSAAQLPELKLEAGPDYKTYADQPSVDDAITPDGILGQRSLATAIVPSRAGALILPAIQVSWWNTQAQRVEHSSLPARGVRVLPASQMATPVTALAPASISLDTSPLPDGGLWAAHWLWPGISAVLAALWLSTLLLWWKWSGRGQANVPEAEAKREVESRSVRQRFQQLKQACERNDPAAARNALIQWLAQWSDRPLHNLDDVRALQLHSDLPALLTELEQHLYGQHAGQDWDGKPLFALAKQLRQQRLAESKTTDELGSLYPL